MTPTPTPPPPSAPITQPLQPPPPLGQTIAPTGIFPGSLTPGWNDPPPISDGANNSSNRRPRLDLRKRVAYPMNSNENNAQPTLPPQPPFK